MDDLMMGRPEPTKEQEAKWAAERKAEKKTFDAEARRHHCSRCHAREVETRLRHETSRKPGVLDIDWWLCPDCSRILMEFMTEVSEARREIEAPLRHADLAERRRVLIEQQAEAVDKFNRERVEKGLAPLDIKPIPPYDPKPGKKPKRRK